MSDDEQMIELMRLQLRGAFWTIGYHERALHKAHKYIGVMRSFLKHTDLSVLELAQWLLGNALHEITHHEEELKKAHAAMGNWKALMLRARIELPLTEIEEEALRRLHEC